MIEYGPPERVYVELEYYDGPRFGIAGVNGVICRFESRFDPSIDDYTDTFALWPIESAMLELEIEQWCIFVEWHTLHQAGNAGIESHPGNGGINPRWDELQKLLKEDRSKVPAETIKAFAKFEASPSSRRYETDGPTYTVRWHILTN
jgi:hypothetical protein